MKYNKITPSLLAVPKEEWKVFFSKLDNLDISNIHFDVMEFDYVKNTAFDSNDLNNIPSNFKNYVHIMAYNLEEYLKPFLTNKKTYSIVFQYEPFNNHYIIEKLNEIKSYDKKAGIAIKPTSEFRDFKKLIKHCDHLVVMGVEPGFGGQKLMIESLVNLKKIKKYIKFWRLKTTIEFDGGINDQWYDKLKDKVDFLVSGSFFYKYLIRGE